MGKKKKIIIIQSKNHSPSLQYLHIGYLMNSDYLNPFLNLLGTPESAFRDQCRQYWSLWGPVLCEIQVGEHNHEQKQPHKCHIHLAVCKKLPVSYLGSAATALLLPLYLWHHLSSCYLNSLILLSRSATGELWFPPYFCFITKQARATTSNCLWLQ